MRLGLIAAAQQRGLGYQTLEVYRHLAPDVVVVVDPGPNRRPTMPVHADWYPGATVIEWTHDGRLPGALDLFADCDVVYSAETFYDWSLPPALDRLGVATILHANPELYVRHDGVSATWLPTSWLSARFDFPVVQMGVPTDYFPTIPEPTGPPWRIVHPAGTGAAGDRNGTIPMAGAAKRLRQWGHTVDMVGPIGIVQGVATRAVDHWSERDAGAIVSVIPRRYGGLCMPALEAFAAGVPVMMPDIEPQANEWPIVPIPHRKSSPIRLPGGLIPTVVHTEGQVATSVARFVADQQAVADERQRVRAWAQRNSWAAVLPTWHAELGAVIR